jgi:hypothetical protein
VSDRRGSPRRRHDPDEAITADPRHWDQPLERVEDQVRDQEPQLESMPEGSEPGPGPNADDPMDGPAPTG